MLKHTIDSRKGWEIQVDREPETIKHLLPGVPVIPGMNYPEHMMGTKVVGEFITVRAENLYTGRVIELDNPRNWEVLTYYDEAENFTHATFSWESE